SKSNGALYTAGNVCTGPETAGRYAHNPPNIPNSIENIICIICIQKHNPLVHVSDLSVNKSA
ncbi:MAG: hypothetical protein WBZ57_11600, partial [Pseudomonas graminis]